MRTLTPTKPYWGFILICSCFALSSTAGQDMPTIAVGDPALKGTTIGAYDATWNQSARRDGEWHEVAKLTETAKPTTQDGRAVLEHIQTMTRPDGIVVRRVTTFDRGTLEPLGIEQQIENGPPNAPKAAHWDFDGPKLKTSVTKPDGQVDTKEAEIGSPMFYGMTFGLVLASLPLEESYTAKLPVLIPQQGAAKYWLIARVVGKEPFRAADGKTVEAWAVETDWADYESGEITSVGGADQPGGTYYVVPDPPAGFPYVPKYANDTVIIEVAP